MKKKARSMQKLSMTKMKNMIELDKTELKKLNLDLKNDL